MLKVIILIITMIFCACGTEDTLTQLKGVEATTTLGQAYDSGSGELIENTCFTKKPEDTRQTVGQSNLDLIVTYDFDSTANRHYTFQALSKRNRGARRSFMGSSSDFNKENDLETKFEEKRLNYYYFWKYKHKKNIFVPSEGSVDPRAAGYSADEKARRCGDSFISALEYRSSVLLTVQLRFDNKTSTSTVNNVSQDLALNLGILHASAVSRVNEFRKEGKNITSVAVSVGSDNPIISSALEKIIGGKDMTCPIDNWSPCFDKAKAIADHVSNAFKSPDIATGANVSRYETKLYGLSAAKVLEVKPYLNVPFSSLTKVANFEALYKRMIGMIAKAEALLSNLNKEKNKPGLDAEKKARLEQYANDLQTKLGQLKALKKPYQPVFIECHYFLNKYKGDCKPLEDLKDKLQNLESLPLSEADLYRIENLSFR